MYRITGFLLLIAGLYSCQSAEKSQWSESVDSVGTLRAIMHQNDVTPKAFLDKLPHPDNLYGLGPVAYLKGEFMVYDGEAIVAVAENDSTVRVHGDPSTGVAMMVATRVNEWMEVELAEDLSTQKQLESFLLEVARERGINPDNAFPFRLEGTAKSLDWHVIDWESGDTEHSHQRHRESGPHGNLAHAEVNIIGFCSTRHSGVFKHYDSSVHMHFVAGDMSLAGHVDALIPGDMRLFLPKG